MSNSSYAFNLIVASKVFFADSIYILFGLGLIGNLLNILVFTNLKIFHLNRCAFYLIVESILDIGQLIQIIFNQSWRLLLNGTDPTLVSPVWCKLKNILGQWVRPMVASTVCFAAIDQFLSTHYIPYIRQLSSLKLARSQISVAAFLWLLHTIPIAVFLEIRPLSGCIDINAVLINYYSFFFYPVLSGLLPIFVSSMFSILAYRNVRHIVRRQIPINRRRLDQQLTAMIFVRVISFVLMLVPYTIYQICTLRLTIVPANTLEYAANLWAQTSSLTLAYVTHAANFYIFFATSKRYRRQVKYFLVKKCWKSLKKMCHAHENRVQPFDRITIESEFELN